MKEKNNFLIISEPRTGSIYTTKEYCKEYYSIPIFGLLYRPQSGFKYPNGIRISETLGVQDYTDKEILKILSMGNRFIGHGHWHSLSLYSDEIIERIKDFKIIDIRRNPLNQLLSIIMHVRNNHPLYKGFQNTINKKEDDWFDNKFTQKQTEEGLDLIIDWFFEMKVKTQKIKKQFNIHKTLDYLNIGNNKHKEMREKKIKLVMGSEGMIMLEKKLSSPKYQEIMKNIIL